MNTITGFDIYIRAAPDQPHLLYAQAAMPFSEAHARRLSESVSAELFISTSDSPDYFTYLEQHLSGILTDPAIRVADKSTIVHMSAQNLVRDVFENSELKNATDRSAALVEKLVRLPRSFFCYLPVLPVICIWLVPARH